jgi:hypothetical protein
VKYAWVFPFVLGVFFIIGGLQIIIAATTGGCATTCLGDPVPGGTPIGSARLMTSYVQEIGLFNFFFGGIMIMVGYLGIRRGVKFASWVLLWFFLLGIADNGLGLNLPALIDVLLAGLGLLFSYRRFFPRKQVATS